MLACQDEDFNHFAATLLPSLPRRRGVALMDRDVSQMKEPNLTAKLHSAIQGFWTNPPLQAEEALRRPSTGLCNMKSCQSERGNLISRTIL